jgi:hypothetical protein
MACLCAPYKLDDRGRRVFDGRDHTYIVLDALGNCLAHIPGTALGAVVTCA